MLDLNFVLLQYGSPRGPSTQNIFSSLVILGITLTVILGIYIFKPKLRPWVKPLLFTTITGILIFLYIFLVVRNKEQQILKKELNEQQMP
jgi:hypothetical protein